MQITKFNSICDSYVYPYVGQLHSAHMVVVRNVITFVSVLLKGVGNLICDECGLTKPSHINPVDALDVRL